jgi:hypothetical protein
MRFAFVRGLEDRYVVLLEKENEFLRGQAGGASA